MQAVIVAALVVVIVLWTAYAVRRHYFPAPVPWGWEDEQVAVEVAQWWGVTLEEARLAVLAWRS